MYIPIEWVLIGIYIAVLIFFIHDGWDFRKRWKDGSRRIERPARRHSKYVPNDSPLIYGDEWDIIIFTILWPIIFPIALVKRILRKR